MKLIAYLAESHRIDIRPAPVERAWMDATDQRFAYRCLPLNIANGMGWELICQSGFAAEWNGKPGLDAVAVRPDPGTSAPALSHFGHGILTFHVPCLFRTEPGYDLVAQGPINRPKDAIAPLTGVIETDWAPYGFTMNWMFTRANTIVRFERGEPFCHVFPMKRGELETIEPEIRSIATEPDLALQYQNWQESRRRFNEELRAPGSPAQLQKWQKQYYQGIAPDGSGGAQDHRTRVRLKAFAGLSEFKGQPAPEPTPAGSLDQAAPLSATSTTTPSSDQEPRAPTSHRENLSTFWHGEPLSPYQLLCLRSFVDSGHHLTVFTYDPDLALPTWLARKDASEILPRARGLRNQVAHINLFRYALLYHLGGWWVDPDLISLKPDLPQEQFFFAALGERDLVSLGMVKFPAGHPLLMAAIERAAATDAGSWAQSGSPLFTALLEQHGLIQHCRPPDEACPISWMELEIMFDPSRAEEVRRRCANSYAVDLHDEVWRGAGIPHRFGPPEGSFLDMLVRQHAHDVRFPAQMAYTDVKCWIKHLRDNIELDARLRVVDASRQQCEARCRALQHDLNNLLLAAGNRAGGKSPVV
jgi:hypothetical protein